MRERAALSSRAGVIALVASLLSPAWIVAQAPATATRGAGRASRPTVAWKPPVTAHGDPDLQGVWVNNSATPLERPKEYKGRPLLTDAEVAELQRRADRIFRDGRSDYTSGDGVFLAAVSNLDVFRVQGATAGSEFIVQREFENRTSLIVDPADGTVPPLTDQARRRQGEVLAVRQRPSGPADLANTDRCITWGVPKLLAGSPYTSYYRIFQAPGYVVLHLETDVRIIPLDGRPHLTPGIRQLTGDSRGRWEGTTLVVDTTNFSSKSDFRGSAEGLHLVERFRRVSPDVLSYEITIDDRTTWTSPWTVQLRLKQTRENIFEFACHEGNVDIMRGILAVTHADGTGPEELLERK